MIETKKWFEEITEVLENKNRVTTHRITKALKESLKEYQDYMGVKTDLDFIEDTNSWSVFIGTDSRELNMKIIFGVGSVPELDNKELKEEVENALVEIFTR